MRKIKFRGRGLDKGEWRMGYLFILEEDRNCQQTYILGYLNHQDSVYDIWKCATEVDPETVGQFTGLYDKNGKMIFEGDIVKCCGEIRSVIFDEDMAAFEFDSHDPVENPDGLCLCADYNACEVIGNIHDNPELRR